MGIQNYSTTPEDNATLPGINFAIGSAPSTVHPSLQQMAADLATWYAAAEWLIQADTPTYVSATSFTVPTDKTSVYSAGRAIQAHGAGYTLTGTIQSSTYSTLTTVVVVWASGSLDSTVSAVAVGLLQGSQGVNQMVAQLGHSPAWINAPTTISANTSGSVGNTYYLAASGVALVLPSSAVNGDQIGFVVPLGVVSCSVNPSGSAIRGVSGTMTIDTTPAAAVLTYDGVTEGWI